MIKEKCASCECTLTKENGYFKKDGSLRRRYCKACFCRQGRDIYERKKGERNIKRRIDRLLAYAKEMNINLALEWEVKK